MALGAQYGEFREVLRIPANEVFSFVKHPREAFVLKTLLLLLAVDIALMIMLINRMRVFLWLFPAYFFVELILPLVNTWWILDLYGDRLLPQARQNISASGLGGIIGTLILIGPWVLYLFVSKSARLQFRASDSNGEATLQDWR